MSRAKKILIVEDDRDIAAMLELNLRSEGFEVVVGHSGEAGLSHLLETPPHLLILDLTLPDIDGLQICRRVRAGEAYIPIIILSARSNETQRVLGLELGADDYLAKPFSMPELMARVHAVLRRMDAAERVGAARSGIIRHGSLSLDPIAREVRLDDREIVLTSKEFDLLAFFARNAGRAFKRLELLDQVWGYSHDGYEHTVNTHINRLRNKIEHDPANPERIVTVWGVGYKFVGSPSDSGSTAS